ncbi:tetratricopeptide repeat protein [Mongoliitalea daihaiensis]|uniref:tetratricopeptide repeat protein n=1 Tax=Mongoliitalea daihaiensis TaxID=2782006 RepID=UPI001F2E03FC|nr:tetratricopeptide repeat protein [Mongoliitalea daihaiensis]UJP65276.1 tetratricopeptide repeat protein [Mongoliitalea daihaiensis]
MTKINGSFFFNEHMYTKKLLSEFTIKCILVLGWCMLTIPARAQEGNKSRLEQNPETGELQAISALNPNTREDEKYPSKKWEALFNKPFSEKDLNNFDFFENAKKLDSASFYQLFEDIKASINPKDFNLLVKFSRIKAMLIHRKYHPNHFPSLTYTLDDLLNYAYLSQDDFLLARAYISFGRLMFEHQKYDLAASYILNGVKLLEIISFESIVQWDYTNLGEVLFHSKDYEQSITYSKKGLSIKTESIPLDHRILNTIGQNFQRLGLLDSAKFYFKKSIESTKSTNQKDWENINFHFLGELSFLTNDLAASKEYLTKSRLNLLEKVPEIAANSLLWSGKIALRESKLDSGIMLLNSSHQLLKAIPRKTIQMENYRKDIYLVMSEIYQQMGNADSTFFYYSKYSALNDSINSLAVLSDLEITESLIKNEQNTYKLAFLEIAEQKGRQQRNMLIFLLIFFCIGGLIYFVWQKARFRYKNHIAALEKQVLEKEVDSMKNQLNTFTKQLLEKGTLLEKLENQLLEKNNSEEQHKSLIALRSSRILTNEDWNQFRLLFEKVYPGFINRLKREKPDITLAELRIAVLIRMQLSAKEMAMILGISTGSAQRTRLRLKQRLELESEINLEEFLLNIN